MSLNKFIDPSGNPVLFNGERILICCENVDCELKSDRVKFDENGSVYLTSHRILWINHKKKHKFMSLSMPFIFMSGVNMKQPIFGAIKTIGNIKSEDGYSWTGKAEYELAFKNGGCVEFSNVLRRLGTMAHQQAHQFTPPPQPNNPDTFNRNGYGPYQPPYNENSPFGFIQHHDGFSDNIGFINQYEAPPPYPGACPAQIVQDNWNKYPNPSNITNIGFVSPDQDPHSVFTSPNPSRGQPSAPYPETWSLPPSDPNEKKNY